MKFHTFGNKENKVIVLIHGVFTPWQIWKTQITALKEKYYVVVPALDAHIEEHSSEFISIGEEAEQIEKYIIKEFNGHVFAVCGLSMGGAIANRLFERDSVRIEVLVLDGAPLVKSSVISEKVMISSYKSILHKSKNRDEKTIENFKRVFLPEEYLESYLRFADTMSDSSVENMIHSVCSSEPSYCENKNNTRILFLHGTKGNEVYSRRSAKLMKKHYPELTIKCFKGYKHTELAVYKPDEWLETAEAFLDRQKLF